jgi:hypothetical protein
LRADLGIFVGFFRRINHSIKQPREKFLVTDKNYPHPLKILCKCSIIGVSVNDINFCGYGDEKQKPYFIAFVL